MALTLPRPMVDDMIAHAREQLPNECCGVISGDHGRPMKLFRATNAERSPYRYLIDSRDLLKIQREMDANDWDWLVIYHSHTHTPAYPSPTDLRSAHDAQGEALFPDAFYVIVSLAQETPDVRAYRLRDRAIAPEQLLIADETTVPAPRA